MLEPGQIVRVHSLQSEAGQKLNGKRGFVVRRVEERYEVRIEHAKPMGGTNSIRGKNLAVVADRLPLPEPKQEPGSRPRGVVQEINHPELARIVCELLVMFHQSYQPPKTMLTGYAGLALSQFDRFSLKSFTCNEMEWFAGLFALSNYCKQGPPKTACEDIVFAFLEGDPMYTDVFVLSMTFTPYIGSHDQEQKDREFRANYRNPKKQLTPDQWTGDPSSSSYAAAMTTGPLGLLDTLLFHKKKTTPALAAGFAEALKRSPVYHMLVQRLLRWIATEGILFGSGSGLGDGNNQKLGEYSRRILAYLCKDEMSDQLQDMFEKGPIDKALGAGLLTRTSYFDSSSNIRAMFTRTFSEISHGQIM